MIRASGDQKDIIQPFFRNDWLSEKGLGCEQIPSFMTPSLPS